MTTPIEVRCTRFTEDVEVSETGYFEFEGKEYHAHIPPTWYLKGYRLVQLQLPDSRFIVGKLDTGLDPDSYENS